MTQLTDITFLVVGKHGITVELVDNPAEFSQFHSEKKDNLLGLFAQETLTIYVKKDLPESLFKDTLLHELLHTLWFLSGASAVGDEEDEIEELLISMLTPWLMSVLQDNPKLGQLYVD